MVSRDTTGWYFTGGIIENSIGERYELRVTVAVVTSSLERHVVNLSMLVVARQTGNRSLACQVVKQYHCTDPFGMNVASDIDRTDECKSKDCYDRRHAISGVPVGYLDWLLRLVSRDVEILRLYLWNVDHSEVLNKSTRCTSLVSREECTVLKPDRPQVAHLLVDRVS